MDLAERGEVLVLQHVGSRRGDVRVQSGTGSGQQIGGNILCLHSRILLQKIGEILLHPLGQSRIGGRIVLGAGSKTGKFTAVQIEPAAILIFCIDIVVISRRTAPEIAVADKLLPHMFRAEGLTVDCEQTAICLPGEQHPRQPCKQAGISKTTDQHQYQGN